MSHARGAAVLVALVMSAPASALTISDGDFSSFTFDSFGNGSATVTLEAANGNPGARINITTNTGAGQTHAGTALKTDVSTSIALEGLTFTLSLDVLSGPGAFGAGQAILLLVEQSGSVYVIGLNTTGSNLNSFTTLNFPGTLLAASFSKVSGGGPANPVFDGSAATRFGFAGQNSSSGSLTNFYDNFNLVIDEPTPTPTDTPTITETPTITQTPSSTSTPTPSSTPTESPTSTATGTATATATVTLTSTASATASATPTRTNTATPTNTPSVSAPTGPPAIPTMGAGAMVLLAVALVLLAVRRLRAG
jgi:hypothetical protein